MKEVRRKSNLGYWQYIKTFDKEVLSITSFYRIIIQTNPNDEILSKEITVQTSNHI